MQKSLLIILFLISVNVASAQELTWTNNLDKAVEVSNKEHKPILLFFTGSDWCGWCKRLQAEVFEKPEFKEWATKNVVLMEVDFPRRVPLSPELQAQNGALQQFFQVQGYPTIWLVNAARQADGKLNFEKLGQTGYVAGGPEPWLNSANQILSNK
ncbi:MAG TPA: thioredoxin family protein [Chitinophagaceae bacterium]|nr:thioredoxin family protein [Chitinophagaceae bacterium]